MCSPEVEHVAFKRDSRTGTATAWRRSIAYAGPVAVCVGSVAGSRPYRRARGVPAPYSPIDRYVGADAHVIALER
jgi:hypothetical protein